MAFPFNDEYWTQTSEFLEKKLKTDDKLVGPNDFSEIFEDRFNSYSSVNWQDRNFQWLVIHKGAIDEIEFAPLNDIGKKWNPVFANEVFVVFSDRSDLTPISHNDIHLKSFWKLMNTQQKFKQKFKTLLKKVSNKIQKTELGSTINIERQSHSTEANPNIDYSSLSITEIKKNMDLRYDNKQAYNFACLWDTVRAEELNQRVLKLIGNVEDKRIIEIGCGVGGSASYISSCAEFIGTDLSESAIAQATQSFGNKPNFMFAAMDAMNLEFEDNRFDIAIAKEVIEHLPNPTDSIKELFRVLKPNGLLVLTSPNRDSLHLRINRKLGYSDFKCSFDHIKEFTFDEAADMITKEGFIIKETGGVFLQPYWGIPNVDCWVRDFTDNDPEIVEITRELGERVGAKYAFCFVISCIKPDKIDS